MSSAETEIAGVRVPHGIYHIVVVSPGRFTDERLTDREYVTITPPSVKPDTNQLWQVHSDHSGTIIQRPGSIRPPLSLTYTSDHEHINLRKGDHGHPKEGDKVIVRREFPIKWELDPVHAAKGHFYIRVPRSHLAGAGADAAESVIPSRTLGIAIAPERINPPFLEIDHEDQLEWVFQRVSRDDLEQEDRADESCV